MLINYKSKFSRTFLFIALMQFAATSFAQVPVVKFGASKIITEIYEGTNLYDSSSNSPTQWEWNVYDSTTYKYDPVDPVSDLSSGYVSYNIGSTPNSKNPSITFYREGKYTVTLRCKNATGWSNKLVINKYIHVIANTNYYLGFGTYGPNNDNVVASDYGSIFDDGGPNGKYANNQGTPTRSYLVIHPCNAKSITLNMTQLKFADSSDVLKVYDDILPNNANLIATWTKGQTTGRTVTAYSGSMYLSFISNGIGIDSGYFGTYTSVLDTAKAKINMDFDNDSVFNNVPIRFENKTTGFPGVPTHRWSVDGSIVGTRGEGLNYRFFSDGQYNLCLNSIGCDEDRTVCKTITVSTPANPTKINFAKNSITNKYDRFSLKPITNKADQFEWTISPSSYILLNPPSKPSTYTPGKIIYRDCPGDTLPSPNIWFLDSTCYTITLKAWSNTDSAKTDVDFTKSNYICATDFRKTHGLFGKVYIDNNSDCSLGNGDAILENIPVKLYDSTNKFIGLTYTGQNGLYLFEKTNGKFKVVVDLNELPLKSSCPTGVDSIVKLVTGIYSGGVNFATTCGDADIAIKGIRTAKAVFPGITHNLIINAGFMYKEIIESCQNVNDSAKIKLSIVGKVKYKGMANGTPNPSSVSGNNYTWHIKDLLNFGNQLDLYFKTDTNATSADTIVVIAEIIPFGKDKDSTNNKLKFIYKVRNSYDPNIKQTYPETVLPNYNDWLYYIIQFQNTGTAPAYNIRLEDTLDSYLNYETLQVIDYSHSNRMILNNTVLKFYFDDIMLPDSFSDSKGSNGFVQYRIKPKSNLPLGTKIYNTAYIYFDYNSPVITNTTINEYAQPKGNGIKAIVRDGLTIYPNPGHGLYNIQLSNNSSTKLTVFNSMGQVIKTLDIKNQTVLDLNAFANGIYFISIEQGDKIFHAKVVKE